MFEMEEKGMGNSGLFLLIGKKMKISSGRFKIVIFG